jgi:hypothetical protein
LDWWGGRRVEREGEREELSRRKQTRLLEGREGAQTCKQSFVKKFFDLFKWRLPQTDG